MRRICREHGWTPGQWRNLPRADKIELLAYDRWRDEQRRDIRKRLSPEDWGIGVETIMLALESL